LQLIYKANIELKNKGSARCIKKVKKRDFWILKATSWTVNWLKICASLAYK